MIFLIAQGLAIILANAFMGRVDGAGSFKINVLEKLIICFIAFVLPLSVFAGAWSLLGFAAYAGVAAGHGQYFLNRQIKIIQPERWDFLVKLLFGDDPRINGIIGDYGRTKLYWRNVGGMFVTGMLAGLPAVSISLVFGQFQIAGLFALSGVIKPIAYMIGYQFFNKKEDEGAVAAEWIHGALRGLICAAVIALLFEVY